MSKPPSEQSRAIWVNEELRQYEGFSAILSLLERSASHLEDRPRPQLSELSPASATMMPTEEERAAQDEAINAIMSHPEVANLVQLVQALDEARRAKIVSILFPAAEITISEQK